jgi:hypothetical protein
MNLIFWILKNKAKKFPSYSLKKKKEQQNEECFVSDFLFNLIIINSNLIAYSFA